MSISNTTNKIIYQGDGSTKQFPFSFRIFDETDLVVSLYEIAIGIETELTLNSDYTVTINGDNGGTVIMATAPSSSYKLIIKRILPLTQETDYVEGDPFPAESHERALDKLTMITQQLNEQLDRTVKVDITQTNVETTLPIPDALKFLRWNSDASKLENASGITSTEYPSTISLGLDANKSTNPAEGDIYITTDSQKVYVCHSTGTWTEYKVNILSGTDANKPTTYKKDRFYWATDTKKLYWDNGSSWVDASALLNVDKVDSKDASDFFQKAGSGEINALTEKTTLSDNDIILIEDSEDDYEKKKVKKSKLSPIISEIVISSNCDYIDFTGLDSNVDGGYILEGAIVNNATSTSTTCYFLYVNGDTNNSNYKMQYLDMKGTSLVANRENSSNFISVALNSTLNVFVNIKSVNGRFRYIAIFNGEGEEDIFDSIRSVKRTSTITKITSLRIVANQTNGIGANSRFILKRIRG